jgi:hypothetical protein
MKSKIGTLETIVDLEAELYYWSFEKQEFENRGIVKAQIRKKANTFQYWLSASTDGEPLLLNEVNMSMNPRPSQRMMSFTWNHVPNDGPSKSWLLRFASQDSYESFLSHITSALWETKNDMSWQKAKVFRFPYTILAAYVFVGG